MVSRGDSPVLDRRILVELPITRTTTTASSFRWEWRAFSSRIDPGEYDISSRRRRFPELGGPTDADGLAIPGPDAFPVGSDITFSWDAETLATTIVAASNVDDFGTRGDNLHLELDDALDAFNTDLMMALPPMEITTTTREAVTKWARREVLRASDNIEVSSTSRLNINLARYTLRHDSRIEVGQTLTDENGHDRTILGIQPLDRRRYLDVLAERIS